ncbi:alpha/beta fold hydrolase [Dendrosporobacter sp. 1207_IL3150]|uniref:alpha/beta fold hydrolase n=1 Tax=Dendrosporobacter sp. 1207_IL3150 TaxID=3084054 RepID=UPI002FDB430C
MPHLKSSDLFYTETGTGSPLVFIHGLGASGAMFEPQIEHFSQKYRVICPDLRGNGQSGRLGGPVKTILDRQCDEIAALLDHLKVKKAVFCGISYGGVFTFHFALRHPNKIKAIVIADSTGDTAPKSIKERIILIGFSLMFWLIYFPRSIILPLIKTNYKKWPLAERHIIHIADNLRKYEAVLQHYAILRTNHTKNLHKLSCPTLGMVGNTLDISLKLMQRSLQKIHSSELYVITNSVDPTNLCQPAIFNKVLSNFLNKIHW